MNSITRKRLVARRERLLKQLEALEGAVTASILSGGISSFELDSGEADQKVTFRSLWELQRYQSSIEGELEWIERRLSGQGLVTFNMRRKP